MKLYNFDFCATSGYPLGNVSSLVECVAPANAITATSITAAPNENMEEIASLSTTLANALDSIVSEGVDFAGVFVLFA